MSPTSYEAAGRRYRAAAEPPPEPPEQHRCGGCGRRPRHPGERVDLATDWILPGPGGPEIGHFCRGCTPPGPVVDLTCIRCGSGPLLAGAIAEHPERAEPLLTAAGWRLAGPTCPPCTLHRTTPPPSVRTDGPDDRQRPSGAPNNSVRAARRG